MANEKTIKQYRTFKDFMVGEFSWGELEQLSSHGADTGWPHITYTRDSVRLFDAYEDEIYDILQTDAENAGANPLSYAATFRRADMAFSIDGFKNMLVWYAAEAYAYSITEEGEYGPCDDTANLLPRDDEDAYEAKVCRLVEDA